MSGGRAPLSVAEANELQRELSLLRISAFRGKNPLSYPAPAEFLRWEGSFGEPNDPVVRVDLLPGEPSGPAEPVTDAHEP